MVFMMTSSRPQRACPAETHTTPHDADTLRAFEDIDSAENTGFWLGAERLYRISFNGHTQVLKASDALFAAKYLRADGDLR